MPAYERVTSVEAKTIQGPRPGALALSDVVIEHYMDRGVRSGGIYNSRRVRGGRAWSLHAAGRGIDWMCPTKQVGDELFLRLIHAADACGVCEVIWNRQRWTEDKGVQQYRGVNPHVDHVHVGMTIDVSARPDTKDLRRWFKHFLFDR